MAVSGRAGTMSSQSALVLAFCVAAGVALAAAAVALAAAAVA